MYEGLGEEVRALSVKSQESAVLTAPFIKTDALNEILDSLLSAVKVTVITRWVPEEIASGVSDLGIWNLICERPSTELRLYPSLHAKYYRFDAAALVGSANLTRRGLGWTKNANLELLVEIASTDLWDFEAQLLAGSLEVDSATYETMEIAVAALPVAVPSNSASAPGDDIEWFPRSREVRHLYDCYLGNQNEVISSVFEDGVADLMDLGIPEGLDVETFRDFIAARFQSLSYVASVDAHASTAIDRSAGQALLVELGVVQNAFGYDEWDTLNNWLLEFLPRRFRSKYTLTGPAIERSQLIR